jgi:hypothetical protein
MELINNENVPKEIRDRLRRTEAVARQESIDILTTQLGEYLQQFGRDLRLAQDYVKNLEPDDN